MTKFKAGQSGNPAGKPKGTRHATTLAMEALLDGEAEKLTRKAVELALAGDMMAIRLCLERILPARRDRPLSVALPKVKGPADLVVASAAILDAVASGQITPTEATELAKVLDTHARVIDLNDISGRLSKLEARQT